MSNANKNLNTAVLQVSARGVDCPCCQAWIDGFVSDPRGTTIKCDSCKETFSIDPEAVEF